ncbi:MAG: hypothetical protein ACM32E_18075 [Gemmatimonadota bacterium]
MPVVLLLAAAAVLGGVVLVALGRGGEMATFSADYAPLDLEHVTAADVALLQPPRWLWGYSAQVTEEALQVIAQAVSDRDVEIERLRQQVAELRAGAQLAAVAEPAVAGPAEAEPQPGGAAAGGRPAGWQPAGDTAAVVPEARGESGDGAERHARGSGRPPSPGDTAAVVPGAAGESGDEAERQARGSDGPPPPAAGDAGSGDEPGHDD